MKRLFIFSLLMLVLVLTGYYTYRVYLIPPAISNASRPSIAVEVTKTIAGEMPVHIVATGTLQANQTVAISPEYAGQVAQIYFVDGEQVQANDSLIQLDDTAAKAALLSAEANFHLNQLKYRRASQLVKEQAVSQQALDDARAILAEQQSVVQEKKNILDKMLLRAPFSGFLTARTVDIGQYVNVGQTLVQLVDLSKMRVAYQVPQQFLATLALGQPVMVDTSAYPGKVFTGTVSYISPIIDEQTGTVQVQAVFPNPGAILRPGVFVNITQLLGTKKNVLLLPLQAIVASLNGSYVYRVVDHKALMTKVELGQRSQTQVEILKGLMLADTVVTAGQQKLNDGMPVQIIPSTLIQAAS